MRKFLSKLALGLTLVMGGAIGVAQAETYNFVRINGLAEQAVGELLLKEVYKRAGIDITITAMPGKRALAEASAGRKDGETLRVYGLGEKVKTLIRVPTPLSSLETAAFAKAGSGIKLNGKKDLENYKSVVVSGVLHTKAITEGISGVTVVPDASKLFPFVQKGRADIALSSSFDGQAVLKKSGITDIEVIKPPLKTLELYHYIHVSKADKLVPKIDAIIKKMKDSGELAELQAKFEQEYLDSF
jgi:ABC-type amino acid transport substrate-binding protein